MHGYYNVNESCNRMGNTCRLRVEPWPGPRLSLRSPQTRVPCRAEFFEFPHNCKQQLHCTESVQTLTVAV